MRFDAFRSLDNPQSGFDIVLNNECSSTMSLIIKLQNDINYELLLRIFTENYTRHINGVLLWELIFGRTQ